MRRLTRRTVGRWLALGLAAAGCGRVVVPPTATLPPGVSTIERADLTQARALWASAGARSYVLLVEIAHGRPDDGIAEVEVADGQIRAVRGAGGDPPPQVVTTLTVERLFALVEEALDAVEQGHIKHLEVMFDGHHGLPISISVTPGGGQPPRRYTVRQYIPLGRMPGTPSPSPPHPQPLSHSWERGPAPSQLPLP